VGTSGETTEKDFRFDLVCADDILVMNAGDGRPGSWKPRKRKRAMNDQVTWYAVYESDDATGYDADFTPCESKEAAIREAAGYLSFSSGPNDVVFVVAVPHSICTREDEEASLWDEFDKIDAASFIYLHCGGEREKYGAVADIVGDLRSLADGEDDDLGTLLTRAADEIVRLRGAATK
jgi:hypothetical protein